MKIKLLLLSLVLIPMLSISACGNENNKTSDSSTSTLSQIPIESNDQATTPSTFGDSHQNDDEPEEDINLSGILYDYTFMLEGDTITLPITLGEFIGLGWELSPYFVMMKTLEGNTRGMLGEFDKAGKEIRIDVLNMNDEEIQIEESIVYKIKSSINDENYPIIELPRGIILGVSTIDEVIEAFGWPTRYWELDDEYEYDDYGYTYELIYESENFSLSGGIWGPHSNQIMIIADSRRNNVVTEIEIDNILKK